MCKSEDPSTESKSTPFGEGGIKSSSSVGMPTLRQASTISSSVSNVSSSDDGYSSDSNSFESSESFTDSNSVRINEPEFAFQTSNTTKPTARSTIGWMVAGVLAATAMVAFSFWFPFVLAPEAAGKTYDWAFYSYDPETSHFDNTIWTYGTDYALGVITATLATVLIYTGHGTVAQGLSYRAASLQLLYCASVLAGGYAHHTYLTLESRNTLSFRMIWTVCVGTVCAASISMGMSASRVIHQFQQLPQQQQKASSSSLPSLMKLGAVPEIFWSVYGVLITAVCAYGGISFQRPACDIFIAGITQSFPTFYVMIFFALVQHKHVSNASKLLGFVGFIFNAQLLPAYPLLVQYTDLSLAAVNTLLHCNLCTAWTMQGLSMLYMCKALIKHEQDHQPSASSAMKKAN